MIKIYETSKKGLGGGNFIRYAHDHTNLTLLELYQLTKNNDVSLEAINSEHYFLGALKQYEERIARPLTKDFLHNVIRRTGEYGGLVNYIQWLEAVTGVA